MMRILLLTPLYPPAVGGAATYFADIVPHLEAHPAIDRLVLLTERLPGEPGQYDSGKLTVLRLLPTRVSQERPYPVHALTYWQTQFWFRSQLPRLVDEYRLDLVHFHTRYRGCMTYRSLAKLPVPVLADLRDKMSNPTALESCSRHLLCCAQGVADFALAGGYPANRTTHIPIPFALPAAQPPAALHVVKEQFGLAERPYLLYVGDITENKGVYALLDAFDQWRPSGPDAALVLAGINREGRPFLERLNKVPRARYLGHLSHKEVLALMQAAEIVVLPSRLEGLPRTILEAVALGKKVLCPPNIPEFDTHLPDFVLPEVSASAIKAKLSHIWQSSVLPQYPLANHQVETIVEQIVHVYTKMTENA